MVRITHSLSHSDGQHSSLRRGEEQGSKSPFSLLSEPISPSSLLYLANFSLRNKRLTHFFSLHPTWSSFFPLLPTFFGLFFPPPYSVPTLSLRLRGSKLQKLMTWEVTSYFPAWQMMRNDNVKHFHHAGYRSPIFAKSIWKFLFVLFYLFLRL